MTVDSVSGAQGVNSREETPNLQEIHDFLIDLAFKAGETITSALPLINGVGSKKNSESKLSSSHHSLSPSQAKTDGTLGSDLVTEYDRAVEQMVSTALREKYPQYKYAPLNSGEESNKCACA